MTHWNVRRDEPTIPGLTQRVSVLTKELAATIRASGVDSREARNAQELLRFEERRLEHAKHKAAEFERRESMTPAQIVDRSMER